MKKQTRKLFLGMMIGAAALTMVSCSSDDGGNTTPDKKHETPAEKATIELAIGEVSDTAIQFTVETTNAKSITYYAIASTEKGKAPIVTEQDILTKGTTLNAWEKTIEIKELTPETEYYIFAIAKNSDGISTIVKQPITATTQKKIDVSIELSAISSTHEQILFTITPTGAKKIKYKIVKSSEKLTFDEVLATGGNIMNVKAPSSLKPKGFEADTEYTIYVAAESMTDAKLLKTATVKTKKADEAVNDGTIIFSTLEFTSELEEKAGQKLAYYNMTFKNADWQAQFEIGALSTDANTIKDGKYTLSSKRDAGKPGPERIADNFVVKDLKTGKTVLDIDYGDITITKENGLYKIVIDMVKLDIKNERFKGSFQGTPLKK
ncbi:MAG: hypothetical protein LBE34_14510 [Flavobacteriaceae bacterium]|jgi:hypothetical protein|nr:hypothetical protein [Flavobacteriaceae bacterium]